MGIHLDEHPSHLSFFPKADNLRYDIIIADIALSVYNLAILNFNVGGDTYANCDRKNNTEQVTIESTLKNAERRINES